MCDNNSFTTPWRGKLFYRYPDIIDKRLKVSMPPAGLPNNELRKKLNIRH